MKDALERKRGSGRKGNALLKSSRAPHASRPGRRLEAALLGAVGSRGTRWRGRPGVRPALRTPGGVSAVGKPSADSQRGNLHTFTSVPRSCPAGRAPAPPVKGGERRTEGTAAGTYPPPGGWQRARRAPTSAPGAARQPDLLLRLQLPRARHGFSCGEPQAHSLGMVPLVPHGAAGCGRSRE